MKVPGGGGGAIEGGGGTSISPSSGTDTTDPLEKLSSPTREKKKRIKIFAFKPYPGDCDM